MMRHGWRCALLAAAALAAGSALLAAAHRAGPLWGEDGAVRWLQARTGSPEAARIIRWMTSTEPVTVAGLLAAAAGWWRGAVRFAIVTAVLFATLPVVQSGLKELADRPRPAPPTVELRAGASSPSFPAGHAMSGLVGYGWAAVTATRSRLPRVARAGCTLCCAAIIGASAWANLWTGVHWPTDIAGGFAWGTVMVSAGAAAWRPERRRTSGRAS